MSQAAHAPISIGKGMDQFRLIVEHKAADEHMIFTTPRPIRQFHNQTRDKLWKRAKMRNMFLVVHNTYRTGAEYAGLFHQAPYHYIMGSQ